MATRRSSGADSATTPTVSAKFSPRNFSVPWAPGAGASSKGLTGEKRRLGRRLARMRFPTWDCDSPHLSRRFSRLQEAGVGLMRRLQAAPNRFQHALVLPGAEAGFSSASDTGNEEGCHVQPPRIWSGGRERQAYRRSFSSSLRGQNCPLRHKGAARESITWPALRQNPFNLNIAVPSPTVSSEA